MFSALNLPVHLLARPCVHPPRVKQWGNCRVTVYAPRFSMLPGQACVGGFKPFFLPNTHTASVHPPRVLSCTHPGTVRALLQWNRSLQGDSRKPPPPGERDTAMQFLQMLDQKGRPFFRAQTRPINTHLSHTFC